MNDFRSLAALTAAITGLGAFLLGLVALDLIGAAAWRLWLLASPRAARQARFRAVLAAYRGLSTKRGRKRR